MSGSLDDKEPQYFMMTVKGHTELKEEELRTALKALKSSYMIIVEEVSVKKEVV